MLRPASNRWFAQRYSVNNAWNFNGNNRNLNNNNVNNTYQVGAVAILPHLLNKVTLMTDEQFFSLLLQTMFDTRRNKRYGRESIDFERNWAAYLVRMMRSLQERSFRIDHNYTFLVSIPKWREIFATSCEGRIADHLLCGTLAPYVEEELHPRTFNNRIGKGSEAAINQVIEDIYEVTHGHTLPARIIKWDLRGFFPNACCDEIERQFSRLIDRHSSSLRREYCDEMPQFLKWLAMVCVHCCPTQHCERRSPKMLWRLHIKPEKSLFGKPDGIGAPIGRLTSQIGMGLYLNDDVRWLNDKCGIHATLYMDDCVMVVPERRHQYALSLFPILRQRLAAKGISLNEKKFYDQPYQHGLEFLGSHIKPHCIHLNNATYARARMRICEINNAAMRPCPNIDSMSSLILSSFNSYSGLLKARTDHRRLQNLLQLVAPIFYSHIIFNAQRQCLTFRPEYSPAARLRRKYHIRLTHKNKRKNDTSRNSDTHRRTAVHNP